MFQLKNTTLIFQLHTILDHLIRAFIGIIQLIGTEMEKEKNSSHDETNLQSRLIDSTFNFRTTRRKNLAKLLSTQQVWELFVKHSQIVQMLKKY